MIVEVESGDEFLEVMSRFRSEGRRVYMVDWKPKKKKGVHAPHAAIHASDTTGDMATPTPDPEDEPF